MLEYEYLVVAVSEDGTESTSERAKTLEKAKELTAEMVSDYSAVEEFFIIRYGKISTFIVSHGTLSKVKIVWTDKA
jgi:hypothetical protein